MAAGASALAEALVATLPTATASALRVAVPAAVFGQFTTQDYAQFHALFSKSFQGGFDLRLPCDRGRLEVERLSLEA